MQGSMKASLLTLLSRWSQKFELQIQVIDQSKKAWQHHWTPFRRLKTKKFRFNDSQEERVHLIPQIFNTA